MSQSLLLIGSGGREDALAWKLSQSPLVTDIWVLPGNPAMNRHPKVQTIAGTIDAQSILSFCTQYHPSLVMIGPEQPIVDGVADILRAKGFAVCAPSAMAAQLEGSKIFSKTFMNEFDIPTATSVAAYSYQEALDALEQWDFSDGIVIKSDALAGGKGVVLCDTKEEAQKVVHQFMIDPTISVHTEHILFEQKLHGREVSAFALLDGEDCIALGYACDYKRVYDGDQGPNTGGMGTYTPQGWPLEHHKEQVRSIFRKVCAGMKKRGHPYQGILFAGLMIDEESVQVIEFNIRFGDPETQVIMPTLKNDLYPLLLAASQGTLHTIEEEIHNEHVAVHVVLAAQGYPSIGTHPVQKGDPIHVSNTSDLIFYAGVSQKEDVLYTSGGRVLGTTAVGESIEIARQKAYASIAHIHFDGMHYRTDIGKQS